MYSLFLFSSTRIVDSYDREASGYRNKRINPAVRKTTFLSVVTFFSSPYVFSFFRYRFHSKQRKIRPYSARAREGRGKLLPALSWLGAISEWTAASRILKKGGGKKTKTNNKRGARRLLSHSICHFSRMELNYSILFNLSIFIYIRIYGTAPPSGDFSGGRSGTSGRVLRIYYNTTGDGPKRSREDKYYSGSQQTRLSGSRNDLDVKNLNNNKPVCPRNNNNSRDRRHPSTTRVYKRE